VVELREARRAAARTGLGLQYVLKEARVFDIWERLSPFWLSEKRTVADVVCKGGTALNKVYFGPVQRFSEDIDLDIFFQQDINRRERIEFIKSQILPLLQPEYSLPKERLMKTVVRFDCHFTNELDRKDNIRVEFNLETPFVGEVSIRDARSEILKTTPVKVRTYSLPTLLAKKIKAFYERESGKDLYDIYYGLRENDDDEKVVKMLREVLPAERIVFREFSEGLSKQLVDEERIRRVHSSTNPYIPRDLRLDWVTVAREIRNRLLPLL
jgi:predicted nucleotidyltransferase component of viral defense system